MLLLKLTITDKSIDTFERNKRFLSISFRNFKSLFFLSTAKLPLLFSMLKYPPWTLSHGYNIEKGRGGINVNIGDWNSLVQRNMYFSECTSSAFVHDCRLVLWYYYSLSFWWLISSSSSLILCASFCTSFWLSKERKKECPKNIYGSICSNVIW